MLQCLDSYHTSFKDFGVMNDFHKRQNAESKWERTEVNKVAALLLGMSHPIHIGGILAVEHRGQTKVEDFNKSLDLLFSQFNDAIAMLEKLTTIYLSHPVNAMTAICKKLSMPKKAAMEAIAMFEGSMGSAAVTAHDVFMALQEIIFILKTEGMPEGKLLVIEENLARALSIRWSDFDLARTVSY